ncbi:MAG: hypothetical protein ACJAUL_001054 [Paraglaciecola sp.]
MVEQANFDGAQIGVLQSLREVPGFLAFTTVFVLLVLKEQTLTLMSIGVVVTGWLLFALGFYCTLKVISLSLVWVKCG